MLNFQRKIIDETNVVIICNRKSSKADPGLPRSAPEGREICEALDKLFIITVKS